MFYVVSLYSLDAKGDSPLSLAKRQARYEYTMKRTAEFLKAGNFAYSPITHCHEMAKRHEMPAEYQFWKAQDRHMVELSEGLIVLDMKTACGKDYKDSEGMSDEIEYAYSIGKPVIYIPCPDFFDPVAVVEDTSEIKISNITTETLQREIRDF